MFLGIADQLLEARGDGDEGPNLGAVPRKPSNNSNGWDMEQDTSPG